MDTSPRLPPFIYRDAVPPERFFDRRDEVRLFESMLKAGERRLLIAIVAPLKFGKTSLMLKYIDIVKKYEDIIPLYMDLRQETAPIRAMVEAVTKAGADAGILQEYEASRDRPARLFAVLDEELRRLGKWLFVFFDEFHLLPEAVRVEGFFEKFSDERIFAFFRAVAEGRRISYIVAGSVIEPLMDALDVWGGRFRVIYLGPFTREDALDMMRKLFSEAGMKVSNDFLEALCDAAGYHPFYMQFMGSVVYALGKTDKLALREAKRRLWEYVGPIFGSYVMRLWREDRRYISVLKKVATGEELTEEEAILAFHLVRKGFLKPTNGGFTHIDPLFERYMAALRLPKTPPDVAVVGHWAERIVGNYLLRKGYLPYYSHDSRGAFDIYVRVRGVDVGIQVRYSSSGEVRLSTEEARMIIEAAEETGWRPVLALVSKGVEFFGEIKAGVYRAGEGAKEIEEMISNLDKQ